MISRRLLFKSVPVVLGGFALSQRLSFASDLQKPEEMPLTVNDLYPTQSPELVREMVTVAHFNPNRVRELVDAQPTLANAAWDWGFGDWETGLGAASHMGNRDIAEYLLSKGARPTIFSAAMLGQLDVVKAFVSAQPHVQSAAGPHSISLLSHAKAGGEQALPVLRYLQQLGDADSQPQVPIDSQQVAPLVGSYSFGVGSSQVVSVAFDGTHLSWTRVGTMAHTLFHLGELKFYPAGARHARIEFKIKSDCTEMTIFDPALVLTIARTKK